MSALVCVQIQSECSFLGDVHAFSVVFACRIIDDEHASILEQHVLDGFAGRHEIAAHTNNSNNNVSVQ